MEQKKKIAFQAIPDAFMEAITEQIEKSLPAIEIVPSDSKNINLIITSNPDAAIKVPTITLPLNTKHRLGNIIFSIAQALDNPALFMNEINFEGATLRPREKILLKSDGNAVALTDREIELLVYMAQKNKNPVTKENLLQDIWHYQEGVDTHTIETHIYRLRQKLEKSKEENTILVTTDNGYILNTR